MNVLAKYNDVFADVPGKTSLIEHRVELNQNESIRSKPYPLSCAIVEELRGKDRDMITLEINGKSNSPYASLVMIIQKKDTFNIFSVFRDSLVCIKARLNKITRSKLVFTRVSQ